MKVLIVDDDPDTTEVISSSFELGWPGATTVCAFDGAAGIEMALTAEPNLIVLDIGLSDINGYEVCRKIRNFSKAMFPLTHVIICARLEPVQTRLVPCRSIVHEILTEISPLTTSA